MKLLSWFAGFLRRAALSIDGTHPRDPALVRMLGLGRGTASGVRIDSQAVLGYPAVMRAVNILANSVSKIRPHVYERVELFGSPGKQRAMDHVAERLVARRWNEEVSAAQGRKTLVHHALLWGNGFAYIERDAAARPQSIVTLLPDRTRLVRQRFSRELAEISGRPGGLFVSTRIGSSAEEEQFTIPYADVLHVKGLSFNGISGVPVVEILKETFGLGLAAREFGARFFGQGATASGIIEVPGSLDELAAKEFRESVAKAHGGLGKSHLIMLLEEGAKWHQTTIPPEHAQFLQTREFEIREIANAIGIGAHKLGDPSRKSFASLEQSNQEFLDDDVDPWLVQVEDEHSEKLLSEQEKDSGSHFVEFDRKQLVRTQLATRSAHYASGRQWGYYSVNDIRGFENLNPIEGGDVYLQPVNMVSSAEEADGSQETRDEGQEPEEEDSAEAGFLRNGRGLYLPSRNGFH